MVKFETVTDQNAVIKATKFNIRKLTPVYIICSVLFALGAIHLYSKGEKELGIIYLIIFGFGFYPICYGITMFFQKAINRTDKTISSKSLHFLEANDEKIISETKIENELFERTELSYNLIFRAYETKDCFFIYISRSKVYILEKSKIVEGTATEFRKILSNNLRSDFKLLCK